MAKIKQKISISMAEDSQIRRRWDDERGRLYFSVADVMTVLTDSVDARNYWKALKNRLKTNHNQLVMDCNQLKMEASDGKSYLVDVADAETIIKIIKIVAPFNVPAFRGWLDHIDVQSSIINDDSLPQNNSIVISRNIEGQISNQPPDELSTALEPRVDICENKNEIILQIMLPGVSPDKIIIATNMKTITIKGERVEPKNISISYHNEVIEKEYFIKELQWGQFYRKIELSTLVDVDNIVATEFQGLITIKIQKLDQEKNRFIKIKSI